MNDKGNGDTKLLTRIARVRGLLFKLTRTTKACETSAEERRLMVETFIFSLTDYILYLQPLSDEVTLKAVDFNFVLQKTIKPDQLKRERSVANHYHYLPVTMDIRCRWCPNFANEITTTPVDQHSYTEKSSTYPATLTPQLRS